MKKLVYSLLLAFALFTHAQSDTTSIPSDTLIVTDHDRADVILRQLEEELSLSKNQKTQLTNLLAERISAIATLRAEGLTDEENCTALDAIDEEKRAKLKAILKSEQWDIYLSNRILLQEHRERNNSAKLTFNERVEEF